MEKLPGYDNWKCTEPTDHAADYANGQLENMTEEEKIDLALHHGIFENEKYMKMIGEDLFELLYDMYEA